MTCARLSSRFVRFVSLIAPALVLIALASPGVTAQTAEFTQGSKNSNTMSFEVPLGNYPGRGISLPVTLRYSSQGLWRIGFLNTEPIYLRSVVEAIYAEHSTSGWVTSLDVPKIEWPKLNDRYKYDGKPYARGYNYPYTYRVANVFVHMPDGSTHELRKADQVYQDTNVIDMTGTFYAVDGARMRYDSTGETTGTLYLADGTRWIFNGGTVQYIDRNGNTLNYDSATRQWADTLGRVFNMPWPANPSAGDYAYSLPGVNGASLTYVFKFRALSDVFVPDVSGQTQKPLGDYYLPNPSEPPSSSNLPQGPLPSSLFYSDYADGDGSNPSTYTYVVGREQSGSENFNPAVLAQIDLPNGTSYRFFYNAYGELDKVIYPTGGYERYQYSGVPSLGNYTIPYGQASRGVVSRWVSPSGGGADESQWQYSTILNFGYALSVTAPNGTRSETYLVRDLSVDNFGYRDARYGLPYEERIYAPQSQGGAMLRRTLIEYGQTTAIFNRPSPGSGTYTAYRNARPQKSVNLILDTGGDALAGATTTTYDGTFQFTVGLDATASNEYGFTVVDQTTAQTAAISSMPFGPLVRSTHTTFLTSDPNYRDRNILGLASSVTILNAYSQIVGQSTIAYDEPGYPLLTYGSLTGWTDPQTAYRGNATTTSRWLDYPTSSWVSTHTQYDQSGNVRYAWDARGNQSQVEYSDTYARAFPTQTASAVSDPTGNHGSTTPLVASSVYDLNTGLVTSITDANAKTTTFEYNDPLNRRTRVNLPDGGRTTHIYVDAHTCGAYIQTRTLLNASGSETDSYTFFDGMGRPYRAFTYENQDTSNPHLTVDTQYDSMGRAWRSSNPYRSNGCGAAINPSGNWTTSTYDSLSRVTAVTTPDGAQVSTAYSAVTTGSYIGPSVTVTDPAGKARQSISDASGRVIQVIEDPNGLAHETNYTYDVLNNLRRVEQGGQLRFYGYDSLSRVIRVSTVEQTMNTALNWTDPVTGNNGWTMGLSYDAQGNVTSRVDARNITTTLIYDALNRNFSVSYSDGTPTVYRYFDSAVNGRGRLHWHQAVGVSASAFDAFDSVGRPTQYHQVFWVNGNWGSYFNVQRTYDKAGNVTAQTYPSGHTVSYGYDTAGRLQSFTGNLGDGTQRTYSTGISYSSFGGLQQEQFGTNTPLFNKKHYNVRGQLYDVRVSTASLTSDEWNYNRGALSFYYGYGWGQSGPANNGNVTMQQTFAPLNDAVTDRWYSQDTYTYDSLNRLTSVSEAHGGMGGVGATDFVQAYSYDRWGNRTINAAATWGADNKQFAVDASNNRLGVPAGQTGTMGYDSAGNLTTDTYSGSAVTRVYDAENKMTSETTYNSVVAGSYSYDGDGRRVKRVVGGTETWQVYGLGGELIAEYAANAVAANPQKEYGYRNGELLITAEAPAGGSGSGEQNVTWSNAVGVSVSGNNLTKTAAEGWGNSGAASNQTIASGDGYAEFSASNLTLFGLSHADTDQNYTSIEFGLHVAYDGSLYVFESGVNRGQVGTVTSSDRLRVSVEGGVVKYRKNGTPLYTSTVTPTYPLVVDTALHQNGSTISNVVVSASTQNVNWTNAVGVTASGNSLTKTAAEGWGNSGAASNQTIASGDGYAEFSASQLTLFGLSHADADQNYTSIEFGLHVAYGGGLYVFESGVNRGAVGTAVSSDRLRVAAEGGVVKYYKNGALLYTSSVTPSYPMLVDTALYANGTTISNVVVSGAGGGGSSDASIKWLVADHLGTPRMVFDQTGSLASVSRHDYLPFGEEVPANFRSGVPGYATADSVRQKFTGYERDAESGLDYAQARYYASQQGRFTSVDPLGQSASVLDPQSFNRYSYVLNNPTNLTDPSGMMAANAAQSWGDVAGLFWGSSGSFGGPETGRSIIDAAAMSYDRRVGDTIFANRLNNLIRKGKLSFEQAKKLIEGNDNLAIEETSVEVNEYNGNEGEQQNPVRGGAVVSPIVIPLAEDLTSYSGLAPYGDGECVAFPKEVASLQGIYLGQAQYNWWASGNVMERLDSLRMGTVLISGYDKNGRYPNKDRGNHAAIFLRPSADRQGFWVLEQIRGVVQRREIRVESRKGYFFDPHRYAVLAVAMPGRVSRK